MPGNIRVSLQRHIVCDIFMRTLIFYYQKRKDGGLRTGVELDGERVLETYAPGRQPPDSALEWFVDVRCRGRRLPDSEEEVRRWLLEQSPAIEAQLKLMAEELATGMDPEWPIIKEVPVSAKGVSIKIVCSAVHRLAGRDIGKILHKLLRSWPQLVASLPSFPNAMAA